MSTASVGGNSSADAVNFTCRNGIAMSSRTSDAAASPHMAFVDRPEWLVYRKYASRVCLLEPSRHLLSFNPASTKSGRGFFSSSMKDDLRYAPSDCFRDLSFPCDFETNATLEAAGEAYHDLSAPH